MPTSLLLKRLWQSEVSRHKVLLLAIILLSLAMAGVMALYPVVIKFAVDMFVSKDIKVLPEIALAIIAVTGLKALLQYFQVLLVQSTSLKIIGSLQNKMLRSLLETDLGTLEAETPSVWASRFMFDASAIREFLNKSLNAFGDLATVVALAASMVWIDWQLSIFALVIYPLASWPIKRIGNKGRQASKKMHDTAAEASSQLNQAFAQGAAIRTYNLEKKEEDRLKNILGKMRQSILHMARLRATVDPLLEVISGLAIAFIFYLLSWRIAHGGSGLGDLTGFITALFAASRPMRSLGSLNSAAQEGLGGLENSFSIIDLKSKTLVSDKAVHFPKNPSIKGSHVSIEHSNNLVGLNDVSFEFPYGEFLALTGPSGAGKSTLLKLLSRLSDLDKGTIEFSGVQINEINLESLRSHVGYISQNMPLFEGSILENVRLGNTSASDQEVQKLCYDLGLNFIDNLPNGFKTEVGREGSVLSGGERQRIVIARATMRDFDILLLDEPTSALDAENESDILSRVLAMRAGKTTVVVTHKLQLLENASQIYVLNEGKIAQVGTHKELKSKSGIYSELLAISR